MVSAAEVVKATGIPRYALYRLVQSKAIPFEQVQRAWHRRPHYVFCLPAVQARLAELEDRKPAPAPPEPR